MLNITILRWVVAPIMLVAGLCVGVWQITSAFDVIQNMRQLERVPASTVGALLPGEANVTAFAEANNGTLLTSPKAGVNSLYYRYLVERETRDSDGKTSWKVERDEQRAVDFILRDYTGSILVSAQQSINAVDWSVARSFYTTQGSYRYSEWRIEPGTKLFVFAVAEPSASEGALALNFSGAGDYSPIVSTANASEARGNLGGGALVQLWIGLVMLSVAVLGLVILLQIHRLLKYLTILTLTLAIVLIHLSMSMMKRDLVSAQQRFERQLQAVQTRIGELYKRGDIASSSIQTLGDFYGPDYDGWSDLKRARVSEIRLNLVFAEHQLSAQLNKMPELLLAPLWGVNYELIDWNLPAGEQQKLQRRIDSYQLSKISGQWYWLGVPLGLLLAMGLSWAGLRRIKHKRLIENLPTSKTAGVACGLAEVEGVVSECEMPDVIDDSEFVSALSSPLTRSQCVWYHYKVEERRGTGKDRRWVKIEERTDSCAFDCVDDEGRIGIEVKGAEIISSHSETQRHGDLRYYEKTLRLGDALYAIGEAAVVGAQSDRLSLQKGDAKDPFILSNHSENDVMLIKARAGMGWFNAAFAALLLALLLTFGLGGSFAATDFLMAALAAPLYMIMLMVFMHYNDLVFLQRRALRNWANIEVSLKKRHNLMESLQRVVKRYFEHEKKLQKAVVLLRNQYAQAKSASDRSDSSELTKYLQYERKVHAYLQAKIEAYPELKGDKLSAQMMASLTRLENEVALMRAGYNDSVTYYNTRIASFPDVFLARRFGFKRMNLIAS